MNRKRGTERRLLRRVADGQLMAKQTDCLWSGCGLAAFLLETLNSCRSRARSASVLDRCQSGRNEGPSGDGLPSNFLYRGVHQRQTSDTFRAKPFGERVRDKHRSAA